MKKLLLFIIGSACGVSAFAQKTANKKYADSLLYRLVLDVNLNGGLLMQDYTRTDDISGLSNVLNPNYGKMTFDKGMSYGFDGQLGLFLGKKRNWGIGAGVAYFMQSGEMSLDGYHVEYKSFDGNGRTFRQLVSSTGAITEKLKITNVNIPVMLKYKKRLNKTWGFTADAGILYNLNYKNAYTSDAAFDYEAIYTPTTVGSTTTYEYDNTPGATNAKNVKTLKGNTNAAQMDALRNNSKYNVGLNKTPTTNTGDYKYTSGSIGYFIRSAANVFLSNNVALNLGLYYMYQPVANSNGNSNVITDKVGDYSSISRSVMKSNNSSFGLNLGVRFFIGKLKDSDHDGTPDIRDQCPTIPGPGEMFGCPDFDHDGIADKDDSCPREVGPFRFHGCPDRDNDGVPDREDACPDQPGSVAMHGCPDRDGDGVADKDDACPDVIGLAKFRGCPDTDGDGIPDNEDKCPTEMGPESNNGCPVAPPPPPPIEHVDMTTPILFEVNKNDIDAASYPVLDEAVRFLEEDKSVTIVIDGYTDNSGSEMYNKVLSLKRANEVRKYLTNKGASIKRLKVVGHGPKDPIADNATPEGRAKNRRATMHVKGK